MQRVGTASFIHLPLNMHISNLLPPFLSSFSSFILFSAVTTMARGPKKHLKRLVAPKHWMLDKLTGRFVSSINIARTLDLCADTWGSTSQESLVLRTDDSSSINYVYNPLKKRLGRTCHWHSALVTQHLFQAANI